MTTLELASLIERGTDRHEAQVICESIMDLPGPALFKLLTDAGVDCIRSKDSRGMLLKRLRLRLTATVRAAERTEV